MNVSCINRTVVGAYFRELTMEPSLRKFFSIIAADGLQEAYKKKSIVTWLNTLSYDPDTIKKYLVQGIGINLRTVLKIARQYARILENYPPDQEGKIRQQFNYLTLVSLVKQVFEQHVDPKNLDISTKGVKITLGFWNFFAKVESGRLFMFHAKTRPISSNREVSVGQVMILCHSKG